MIHLVPDLHIPYNFESDWILGQIFLKGHILKLHRSSAWFSSNPLRFILSLEWVTILVNTGPLECIHLLPSSEDSLFPFSVNVCSLSTTILFHFPFPVAEAKLSRSQPTHYVPFSQAWWLVTDIHTAPSEPMKKWNFLRYLRTSHFFLPARNQKGSGNWKLLPSCYHLVPDTEINSAEDRT